MFIFFKIIISIFLLIGIINPQLAWKMSEGWKYKNVEPSRAYLVMGRIFSIIALLIVWVLFPNR